MEFLHPILEKAMNKRGWTAIQSARFIGVSVSSFNNWLRLRRSPGVLDAGQRAKLENLLECSIEMAWSESIKEFVAMNKPVAEDNIELVPLSEAEGLPSGGSPLKDVLDQERTECLLGILQTIPPKGAKFLIDYYFKEKTYDEIGAKANLSRERVRQILTEAISTLRSPIRKRRLMDFRDEVENEVTLNDIHWRRRQRRLNSRRQSKPEQGFSAPPTTKPAHTPKKPRKKKRPPEPADFQRFTPHWYSGALPKEGAEAIIDEVFAYSGAISVVVQFPAHTPKSKVEKVLMHAAWQWGSLLGFQNCGSMVIPEPLPPRSRTFKVRFEMDFPGGTDKSRFDRIEGRSKLIYSLHRALDHAGFVPFGDTYGHPR